MAKEMRLSYKFGFLGIGLGGTSIASECADVTDGANNHPYSALLINTNKVDLEKIQSKNKNTVKLPIGDGLGAGRDVDRGEKIFIENKDIIAKEMVKTFKDKDYIFIAAGLGGGTGTGGIIQAIGLVMQMKKPFGLILTLPRAEERSTVNHNALKRLNQIYKAMDKLAPVIIVDNKKLFNDYTEVYPMASVEEYLNFSNKFVADTIHDKNIITANFDIYGSNHFDSSEFAKILRTPGTYHFARLEMDSSEIDTKKFINYSENEKAPFIALLEKQLHEGVLSNGYTLSNAKRAAISVLAYKEDAEKLFGAVMTKQLENLFMEVAPLATESPISFYTYDEAHLAELQKESETTSKRPVFFYAILAGLDLPEKRIKEMITLDKEYQEKVQQVEVNKNLFDEFEENDNNLFTSNETSFEDIFGNLNEPSETLDDVDDIFKKLALSK